MDRHIKEVLGNYLKEGKISNGITSERIRLAWDSKMGTSVANQTKSIKFYSGDLVIKVESSVLKYELFQNSTQIITMLNEELGADLIKKVRFT